MSVSITFLGGLGEIGRNCAAVEIEGDPSTRVYTDGSGWYAILEIPPGEHMLRFSKPGYSDVVSAPAMLTAGQIKTVDADL